jgi:hypothetical protein
MSQICPYNTFFSNKKDKSIAIRFLAITIENTKQNLHCKLHCIAIPSAKFFVCLAVTEFRYIIKSSKFSVDAISFSSQTMQFIAMFEQRGMQKHWG